MAALNRPTEANYEVHENIRVDTQDNEDHTFCGIMFPIKAKQDLPVSQILIHGVAVRGQLGPLTVWVSRDDDNDNNDDSRMVDLHNNNNNNNGRTLYRFPLQKRHWKAVYSGTHAPSQREYTWLDFSHSPVVLVPGQVRALYIHSTLDGDEAIVYDNANVFRAPWHGGGVPGNHGGGGAGRRRGAQPTQPRYQDAFVSIWPGKAHLSPRPFAQTPIWGWGNAWRDHREFVGQLRYGVRYQLWQPDLTTTVYGPQFRSAVQTMLACQRRIQSPVALLPDECLYYILNMCRWDWWNDAATALKEQRRRLRQRRRQEQQTATTTTVAAANGATTQDGSVAHPMEESNHDDAVAETTNDVEMLGNNNDDDTDYNDDDDDDDEWQEEDGEDEDSDSEESAWERQHGYRADTHVLLHHDVSSDEESDQESDEAVAEERQAWFRRHFARIHILRALAQADNDNVVMQVDDVDSSDSDNEAAAIFGEVGEDYVQEQDGGYVPFRGSEDEE